GRARRRSWRPAYLQESGDPGLRISRGLRPERSRPRRRAPCCADRRCTSWRRSNSSHTRSRCGAQCLSRRRRPAPRMCGLEKEDLPGVSLRLACGRGRASLRARFACARLTSRTYPSAPPPARIRRHGFIPRVAELNRRSVMWMTGLGALAAAIPVPEAVASVSKEDAPAGRGQAPEAPPPGGAAVTYLFQDDFDGPAGSAPDASKWEA